MTFTWINAVFFESAEALPRRHSTINESVNLFLNQNFIFNFVWSYIFSKSFSPQKPFFFVLTFKQTNVFTMFVFVSKIVDSKASNIFGSSFSFFVNSLFLCQKHLFRRNPFFFLFCFVQKFCFLFLEVRNKFCLVFCSGLG